MSALLEKLKAKKETYLSSAFWKPNEGDILEGKVLFIGTMKTENGEAVYADIMTDKGKVSVFVNSVLEKAFDAESIDEGSIIAIEYLGEEKSRKSKNKYHNYVCVKADADETT